MSATDLLSQLHALWAAVLPVLRTAALALHGAALAVLALYGLHRLWLIYGALQRPRRSTERAPRREEPVVTVQLPLYNEPEVAPRLIEAVAALDWPREQLEIQVLDDSTDHTTELCAAAVAAARARGLDITHLRRSERTGYKAGALEAGRLRARGSLLAVLDSDFVPAPSLLRELVPAFDDPEVGMVQARWEHLNRDASLLTRVQALLLDGHFAIEQRARATRGHIFNFNGTAGIWRATTIADGGGWHADTLTEDLDLSYRAALFGARRWRFVFLDGVAVPAELPERMTAFRSQQFRWAKGSIEVARKLAGTVLRSGRPWPERLEALLHLTHNVPYLATALLVVSGLGAAALGAEPWPPSLTAVTAVITALVLCGYVAVAQRLLARPRPWRALALVPALSALVAGISIGQARGIHQALRGQRSEFVRTPKTGGTGERARLRFTRRPAAAFAPEAALGLVGLAVAALTITRHGVLAALPLALFGAGLLWVALGSLRE